MPWSWNREVYVATATGARAFLAGQEYAHGGVSPQECVLPVIEVAPLAPPRDVTIVECGWEGLRLRVVVSGGADLRVDLRARSRAAPEPASSRAWRSSMRRGRRRFWCPTSTKARPRCLVVLDDDDEVVAQPGGHGRAEEA